VSAAEEPANSVTHTAPITVYGASRTSLV
jgi:hypothetical protein